MSARFLGSACLSVAVALGIALPSSRGHEGDAPNVAQFKKNVAPILEKFCISCHSGQESKGGIDFERDDPTALVKDKAVWLKALRMVQAEMMPPKGKRRPTAEQVDDVVRWIKYSAFEIDPKNPDPGRVTIRRLNRTEYRNTIRDLLDVDFNVNTEFPADDTGHGFDNIGDVLNISPLLLEKYIAAAKSIITQVMPAQPWIPMEKRYPGLAFGKGKGGVTTEGPLVLSYYKAARETLEFETAKAGDYQVLLDMTANESYVEDVFDYNKCRFTFRLGDKVLHTKELTRQNGRGYHLEFDEALAAGKQEVTVEIEPLTKEKQIRKLVVRVVAVTLRGPMAKEHWIRPPNYERFFPGEVPDEPKARAAYAAKILKPIMARAYRRPVDAPTLDRLVRFAQTIASKPGQTFEGGISQAMVAILSSPRFLFREEWTVPGSTAKYPLLDEFSLASRLSYFLWSSMPDEELLTLARDNQLRQYLAKQVQRMLADKKSGELMRNFAGQWLQARAIETANVNAAAVAAAEQPVDPKVEAQRARFRELNAKDKEKLTDSEKKELETIRGTLFGQGGKFGKGAGKFGKREFFDLTPDIRKAMRQETELAFEYVVREDRSLLELIDADYTFLNEKLAKHYGIDKVTGDQMRKITLPADSVRGGILTQGTMLVTTSNPDRTSPVKRGVYILDNILGLPAPPPPANIPPLEEAAVSLAKNKTPPTGKEALALHRSEPLCISCHQRFDPLGLALENFNALGRFRTKELDQPIDSAGELLTGETFKDVKELKKVLVTQRRMDFYRCATEKMLIYALGRGLEYYDTHTVDDIVGQLEAAKGKPSVLINGIIDSSAFQRRRTATDPAISPSDLKAKKN
jgi:hypothetical protein